jgi:hypothetical protein
MNMAMPTRQSPLLLYVNNDLIIEDIQMELRYALAYLGT